MKRQPIEWERIFANDVTNQGLVIKIYKQLIQLTTKEKKKVNPLKNGQKTYIDISPKKIYKLGTLGTWKNAITSYEKNANENYNKVPPHTSQHDHH